MKNLKLIKKLLRNHSKLTKFDMVEIEYLKQKSRDSHHQARSENYKIINDIAYIYPRLLQISNVSIEECFRILHSVDLLNAYIYNEITMKYCEKFDKETK